MEKCMVYTYINYIYSVLINKCKLIKKRKYKSKYIYIYIYIYENLLYANPLFVSM